MEKIFDICPACGCTADNPCIVGRRDCRNVSARYGQFFEGECSKCSTEQGQIHARRSKAIAFSTVESKREQKRKIRTPHINPYQTPGYSSERLNSYGDYRFGDALKK